MIRIEEDVAAKVQKWFTVTGLISVGLLLATAIAGVLALSMLTDPARVAQTRTQALAEQAILAQRVSQTVTQMIQLERARELYELQNDLEARMNALEAGHRALIDGDEARGLPPATDPEYIASFRDQKRGLNNAMINLRQIVDSEFMTIKGQANPDIVEQVIWLVRSDITPTLRVLHSMQAATAKSRLDLIRTGQLALAGMFVLVGVIAWLIVHGQLARKIGKVLAPPVNSEVEKLLARSESATYLPNDAAIFDHVRMNISAIAKSDDIAALVGIRLRNFEGALKDDDVGRRHALQLQISDRLRALLRPGDIVGFLENGDVAISVGPHQSPSHFDPYLRSIAMCFRAPMSFDGQTVFLNPATGVSLISQKNRDVKKIIAEAATATTFACNGGIGEIHVFNAALTGVNAPGKLIHDELIAGMENGALDMRFQRIVGPDGKSTGSLHAVVSLDHPTLGRFLPVQVEEMIWAADLITEYTHWTASALAAAINSFDAANLSLKTIVLRIPAFVLEDTTALESVLWGVDAAGLDPARLTLSSVAYGPNPSYSPILKSNLQRLRTTGFGIVLSQRTEGDFDLNSKRGIAPNALCVTRDSFANIDSSSTQRLHIAATVVHARKFKTEIIAEGVATLQEAKALARAGVAQLSGPQIGLPKPVAECLPIPAIKPRATGS